MPPLFDPVLHEPLAGVAWDETVARAACDAIVDDALASFQIERLWPCHPRDHDESEPERTRGWTSLYLGAAGAAWALRRLTGSSPLRAEGLLTAFEAEPDAPDMRYGLLLGELGVVLVAYELAPSPALADRLERAVRDAIPRAERELLWGAPGAIHAALAAHGVDNDIRWLACVADAADELWRTLAPPDRGGLRLWAQEMYGSRTRYLGLAHGFVGAVQALLRAFDVLSDDRREELVATATHVLDATATWDGDACSWTPEVDDHRPLTRMQICHGAPGVVVALGGVQAGESPRLDELLVAGGEAVWRAGPITRGPGLCHGTAGNGAAFLTLLARTGDERWLDRARAFAMHALGQCARERQAVGHGRHSLWTGDLFLPFHVDACIEGAADVAGLDLL
jgi:hypothetical protein